MKKFFPLAILLCTSPANAQNWNDALVTDRPDTAESSVVVGKNRFQIETSFAHDYDKNAGTTTKTIHFPTLLRFGMLDFLELRMEGSLFQSQSISRSGRSNGLTDLDFGLKAHLMENEGIRPSLGMLAHLTVPTGKSSFSEEGNIPTFKILMDWDLPRDFSFGTNLGFDLPVQDAAGNKFARMLYAVAIGIPSPVATEQLGFFIGASGIIPTVSGKIDQHSVEGGITFLITPDIKVDTVITAGLNSETTDVGTGLGLSWRF